mmetsp:Transcript_43591/g.98185  ORF Transcript_43591/g.98185 Transcript_43591/m.98185 type:complete len:516 (-) Transcript_43591:206-1753(-)
MAVAPAQQGPMATASQKVQHMEDTPAYRTLKQHNLLTTEFRKQHFEDIFAAGIDLRANSSKENNLMERMKTCWCVPALGCVAYNATHVEFFVPAGHVGLLMDGQRRYLFAQPGMHNIRSVYVTCLGVQSLPSNDALMHGNRTILVVEQGYIGLAFDNGQPVLLPPGIHVWTSETLRYTNAVSLAQHIIQLGPFTLLTVDEGYAAVTQNNGRQHILPGGATHLLDHKNWRFEKFLTLKIQTDDLEKIEATSADNITMRVTSTVTWRIVDPQMAATMAAETMAVGGKQLSSDIAKLRQDVLKQAIASLASFIGGVNYSDSFHMAAKAQSKTDATASLVRQGEPEGEASIAKGSVDNPLYDTGRMSNAVEHANTTTNSYGVQISSINILTAVPVDSSLTQALASGAVASAQALQAETAARGNAKAMRIDAEAVAEQDRIKAQGAAQAEVIKARAAADAARITAEGNKESADLLATSVVAVELAKMDKSAQMLSHNDKFFFAKEPDYLAKLILNSDTMS